MSTEDVGCRFHPEGQLIEDYRSGDLICRECGLIVGGRSIDIGSEWRTISSDRASGNLSRVGGAENPLLLGSDLSTTVAQDAECSNFLHNGLKRRRKKTVDQTLTNAFNGITNTADRIRLSKNLVERAKNMFKEVYDKPMLQGRSRDAIATACLYVACREENAPRTFKEVCDAAQKSKKEVGRCFKQIIRTLSIELELITVEDFLPRFCANLELPLEIETAAMEIAHRAGEWDLVPGRSPVSTAGAAIYMASQASTTKKTHKQIAEVAGLSDTTIRQVYKLCMYPKAEQLFPKDFQFATPIEELPLT